MLLEVKDDVIGDAGAYRVLQPRGTTAMLPARARAPFCGRLGPSRFPRTAGPLWRELFVGPSVPLMPIAILSSLPSQIAVRGDFPKYAPSTPQFPRPLTLPVLRQGLSFAVFGKRLSKKAPLSWGLIGAAGGAPRRGKRCQLEGGPNHSSS